MDFSKLPNPYDFANPVSDSKIFAGREEELDEIKYYLDHARAAARPINLALLGPRASGKTSLLNMTEIEAKQRGFCTVRIDLDEGDLKSELQFFYKLFDSLFSSAVDFGVFGGKDGKTFDMYLDMVNSYQVPESKEFCPLLFPQQYAKAMSVGNYSASLSDSGFRKDIRRIFEEVKSPIVIMFDEGNIFAGSRILLEKIRNIFMNVPGYMLVITGTPELFPVMDDVFSPIVRQFKKITLSGFRSVNETELCIKKPLENLGIKYDDVVDDDDLNRFEIHELCSGRPYEINLICHAMFRRLQSKRAAKLALDFAVIEDVRRELETSQDISTRPIIQKVSHFDNDQLEALSLLTVAEGHATLSEVFKLQHVFPLGSTRLTLAELSRHLDYFTNIGILRLQGGTIFFEGDDFDRIYLKYFSREKGVSLNIISLPVGFVWQLQLDSILFGHHGFTLGSPDEGDNKFDPRDFIASIQEADQQDVFVSVPAEAYEIYNLMLKYREKPNIDLLDIRLKCDSINISRQCYAEEPSDGNWFTKTTESLESIQARMEEIGGSLVVESYSIKPISLAELAKVVIRTKNQNARHRIASIHAGSLLESYENNYEEAKFHAEMADMYDYNGDSALLINLGYVMMSSRKNDKAKKYWDKALTSASRPLDHALVRYDLAVLEITEGNNTSAHKKLKECIDVASTLPVDEQECFCLFRPFFSDGEVKLVELRNTPNLLETALELTKDIESLDRV